MPVTVLDFADAGKAELGDILYLIRGTGTDRDKQYTMDELLTVRVEVTTNSSLDLTTVTSNALYILDSGVDLFLQNELDEGLQVKVVPANNAATPPTASNGIDVYSLGRGSFVNVEGNGASLPIYSECKGSFVLSSDDSLTDYDNATNPGTYYMGTSPTNAPMTTLEKYFAEFIPAADLGLGGIQKAIVYSNQGTSNANGLEWYRTFDGIASWSSWISVGFADKGHLNATIQLDSMADGYYSYTSAGGVGELPSANYLVQQEQSENPNIGTGLSIRIQKATVVNETNPVTYVRVGTLLLPSVGPYTWGAWNASGNNAGVWTDLGEIANIEDLLGQNGFGFYNQDTLGVPVEITAPQGVIQVQTSLNNSGLNPQTIVKLSSFDSDFNKVRDWSSIATTTASDLSDFTEDTKFDDFGFVSDIDDLLGKTGFGYMNNTTANFPWASGLASFEVSLAIQGATVQTQLRIFRFDPSSQRIQLYTSIATTTASDLRDIKLDAPFQTVSETTDIDIPFTGYVNDINGNLNGTLPTPTGVFLINSFEGQFLLLNGNYQTTQTAVAVDAGEMYTRYYYETGPATYTWTPWAQVGGAAFSGVFTTKFCHPGVPPQFSPINYGKITGDATNTNYGQLMPANIGGGTVFVDFAGLIIGDDSKTGALAKNVTVEVKVYNDTQGAIIQSAITANSLPNSSSWKTAFSSTFAIPANTGNPEYYKTVSGPSLNVIKVSTLDPAWLDSDRYIAIVQVQMTDGAGWDTAPADIDVDIDWKF